MARSYANVPTAIWRDPRFRALSVPAQHAYLLLDSQADISAAGVLSLNLTRWASRANGSTPASMRAAINELEDHRFVAADEDTEEVLLRPFIAWDRGHTNPKRRPVIRDAAREIESPALRQVLAVELEALGIDGEEWVGGLPDSHADRHPDSLSGVESSDDDAPESSQEDSLSDRHPDTVSPSERVVVTTASGPIPQPAIRNPHSALRPPAPQGGRAGVRANADPAVPEEPPPLRCPDHVKTLGDIGPCRGCRAAREANERWQVDRAAAASAARSSEAHARAEVARAAINACDQCGPTGYVLVEGAGSVLCQHDPGNADRAQRGAAAARALIGRAPKARDAARAADDPIAAATARRTADRDAHQARLAAEQSTEVS